MTTKLKTTWPGEGIPLKQLILKNCALDKSSAEALGQLLRRQRWRTFGKDVMGPWFFDKTEPEAMSLLGRLGVGRQPGLGWNDQLTQPVQLGHWSLTFWGTLPGSSLDFATTRPRGWRPGQRCVTKPCFMSLSFVGFWCRQSRCARFSIPDQLDSWEFVWYWRSSWRSVLVFDINADLRSGADGGSEAELVWLQEQEKREEEEGEESIEKAEEEQQRQQQNDSNNAIKSCVFHACVVSLNLLVHWSPPKSKIPKSNIQNPPVKNPKFPNPKFQLFGKILEWTIMYLFCIL